MEITKKQITKCPICGTPYKESDNNIIAAFGVLIPNCDCEMKAKEAQARGGAASTPEETLRIAGVPVRTSGFTFKTYYERADKIKHVQQRSDYMRILMRMKTWTAKPTPGILLMAGETGGGKTGLAAAALLEFAKRGTLPIRYFYAYDLLTQGVNFDTRQPTLAAALQPAVVVVDEIGIQLRSEAALAFLERVLVGRHEDAKTTIIITNEQPAAFWEITGERVKDRITRAGETIAFTGPSLRDPKTGG